MSGERHRTGPVPPKVTIGLITFNAQPYLREFLGCLDSQEFSDWQVIIVDDGSNDGTVDMLASWAASEPRARLRRNRENQGSVANYNWVAYEAESPYVVWATGHDLWEPQFLSSCVAALHEHADAVIAYSGGRLIGPSGEDLGRIPENLDTRGMPPVDRYLRTLWSIPTNVMIHCLIRRRALLQAGLFQEMLGPDDLLVSKLALLGEFVHVPAELFSMRQVREVETFEDHRNRVLTALAPGAPVFRRDWGRRRFLREYRDLQLWALRAAPLTSRERGRAIWRTWLHHQMSWGLLAPFRRFAAKALPTSWRHRIRNHFEPRPSPPPKNLNEAGLGANR